MIHIILGTKAQLIKMAPVMVELKKNKIPYNFISTGQHKETMDKLLKNFNLLKPNHLLYSGKDITSVLQMFFWAIRILFKICKTKKKVFKKDKKGLILVHGDTFSTLLGALIGKLMKFKVGHVESGLRSFNLLNPFPEEITRVLTFKLSNYYFCSGDWAVKNLKKYKGVKINTKANTLLDSLKLAVKNRHKIKVKIPKEKYAVVTIHRFENIFNKKQFGKIIKIITNISKNIKILFILHKPTKKKLVEYNFLNILKNNKNIEFRPRYDYFEFIKLIYNSEYVISDGGSNQEECFYLGKPCLLLRNETERKEGLGQNVILSKFNKKAIGVFTKNYEKYKGGTYLKRYEPSKVIVKILNKLQK